jgi:hypothetical protein
MKTAGGALKEVVGKGTADNVLPAGSKRLKSEWKADGGGLGTPKGKLSQRKVCEDLSEGSAHERTPTERALAISKRLRQEREIALVYSDKLLGVGAALEDEADDGLPGWGSKTLAVAVV